MKTTGIDLKLQPIGTNVEFCTANSIYDLEKIADGRYTLVRRASTELSISYDKKQSVSIPGSNWSGSALKKDWIGKEMCVEIFYIDNQKLVVTTPVTKLKITAPDASWSYEL